MGNKKSKRVTKKKSVRKCRKQDSQNRDPKTIMGMAYQEFCKYKKKTGLG